MTTANSIPEQLSGTDFIFFGFETNENPFNIAGVSICDAGTAGGGQVRRAVLKKRLHERLSDLPLLRRRLYRLPADLDYPYWIDDTAFDLDYHIRFSRLRKPGNWAQLMRRAQEVVHEPFDMRRPLWELHVIEGLSDVDDLAADSFAIFLRMHHVFADAATSMVVNDALFDDIGGAARKGKRPPAPESDEEGPQPDNLRLLGAALRNAAGRVAGTGIELLRSSPHFLKFAAESLGDAIERRVSPLDGVLPPRSALNLDRMSAERLHDARRFDYRRIRAVRDLADGATFNDIVLAVIGGAMRRYLEEHDRVPEDTMTTVVPINLRKFDGEGDGSNVVSAMMLPVFQEIADPLQRLKAIRKASAHAKRDSAMEANRRLFRLLTGLPSPVLNTVMAAARKIAYAGNSAIASTIVSNVRSFPEPRSVAGAEVKYMFGFGMLWPGVGSLHTCTLYADYLNVGLSCSPDVIPKTGAYMACIEASFAEYECLASGK